MAEDPPVEEFVNALLANPAYCAEVIDHLRGLSERRALFIARPWAYELFRSGEITHRRYDLMGRHIASVQSSVQPAEDFFTWTLHFGRTQWPGSQAANEPISVQGAKDAADEALRDLGWDLL